MTNLDNKKKCLIMRRNTRLLALPVECVSEVIECNGVFPLPKDDPRITGLIVSGRSAVPLLRLESESHQPPRIVILITTREGTVGIPADEVIRVDALHELPLPEMPPPDASRMTSRWPGIIRGIGTTDQQTVLFLEPNAIIQPGY